jgi:hypothetical protein
MRDYLVDTYKFIANVNGELGDPEKADKSIYKAILFQLHAEVLRQKAEAFREEIITSADYNGKNLQL